MRKSAAAIVAVLVLAACSSGSSNSGTPATPSTTPFVSTATAPKVTSAVAAGIDPCKLLTQAEASRLARTAVTLLSGGGPGSTDCAYKAAGSDANAEITVKVDVDAAFAHTDFPTWVQPVPGTTPGFTVTPVANLGDEAAETHSANTLAGIYFRHGSVLVRIAVHPVPVDAGLRAAAATALARL